MIKRYIVSLSAGKIALWSIGLSELVYLIIVLVFDVERPIIGFYLSFVMPLAIAYPVSKFSINRRNELAKLNEHNEMLINILTHDLRAPMSSVHSAVELLQDEGTPKDFKKDLLKGLEAQTHDSLEMIDNVISWGKVHAEKGHWHFDTIDLFEPTAKVCSLYKHEAVLRGVTLENGLKPGLIKVESQRDMVEGLLRNLVNNALRHTSTGGRVTVHSDRPNSISVTDTGEGMSQAEVDRLLNRAKMGLRAGNRITGVGYALIYYFLRETKANIQIESAIGDGTTVTVLFDQD